MPTTPSHSLPYPSNTDPADVPADIAALAEALDLKLDDIAPGQITGPTSGQILIANSSGVVTGTSVTGDVTISSAGATSIGTGAVTSSKLASGAVTTAKLDTGSVTLDRLASALQTALLPVGSIVPYAASSVPTGFLLCDGSEAEIATYAALDALLGTTYGIRTNGAGAPGTTHFRLPDLRGRVAVGRGSHEDVSTLNANDGTAVANRRPSHGHSGTALSASTGLSVDQHNGHAHGPGSLALEPAPNHQHGGGTYETNTTGTHSHRLLGNQVVNRQGTASGNVISAYGSGSFSAFTESDGGHSHTVNGLSGAGGGHGHAFTSGSLTSPGGIHSHTVTDSGHSHTVNVGPSGGTSNAPSYVVINYLIKA